MDERDFFNSLGESRFPKKEATEFFANMRKEGGVAKDLLNKGLDFASRNKAQLIGSAIGSGIAAAYQYTHSKPEKDGRSKERSQAEKNLAGSSASMEKMKTEGKEPGYLGELGHARSKSSVEVAKVNERHPKRAALLAAGMGATAGGGLASLGKHFLG